MVGHTRFKEILDFLKTNIKPHIKYQFNIQTNLIVLNNELIQLFKTYFDTIGVSYDFGIRHVKNGDFNTIFFNNLNILRDNKIPYNGIITLTKKVLTIPPLEFYHFMKKHFQNIHIEKLTYDGEAVGNWGNIGVNNKEYSEYMKQLFKIYSNDNIDDNYFNISPFDAMAKGVLMNTGYSCKGSCSNFFSFAPNGFQGGCTALIEGNKKPHTNKEIVENNKKYVFSLKQENGCQTCEFINVCKEGCPSGKNNVYDESGECRGAKTLLTFVLKTLEQKPKTKNHFLTKKLSLENM
jgi:radical SAM protein with 4Fe4S-binding SPASM domain